MNWLNKKIEKILYLISIEYFPITFVILIVGIVIFIVYLISIGGK